VKYARRLYVTFGVPNPNGGFLFPGNWKAPTDVNADCAVPAGYKTHWRLYFRVLSAGSEAPFEEGMMEIKLAMEAGLKNVVTLSSGSTLDHLSTQLSPIQGFLTDIRDAQQELLEFRTLSGGTLVVTLEHPLLDSEGRMRRADTLKLGGVFSKGYSELDPITSLLENPTMGRSIIFP